MCPSWSHQAHNKPKSVYVTICWKDQSSLCDSIITDCSARVSQLEQQHNLTTREGLAEYLSDVAVLSCGSCFNEYEDYFICIGEDELAEQFREAECVLCNGKFCSERLFDGFANGDIRSCDDEDHACTATCQDLSYLCDVLGCCAVLFVEYGILINTTHEYENWNAKLSQPCSDAGSGVDTIDEPGSNESDSVVSATPAFLVIVLLTLITSKFFWKQCI